MAEFRAMTWNVENLFAAGHDDGPQDAARFAAKIASLADLIALHRPHVLGLQELGGAEVLVPLQAALVARGHEMKHSEIGIADRRGIRVGFLSQRVILSREDVRPFPAGLLPVQVGDDPDGPEGPSMMNQMGRGGLHITVRANNTDVHLITLHWKSKLLSFPGGFQPSDEDQRARFGSYALFRRATEATTVRAHVTGILDPDGTGSGSGESVPVVVMGDLNDEVQAATTQILQGPGGSEIDTRGFDMPDQGDGLRLWNLSPRLVEGSFTRKHRGEGEIIDHIFVSRILAGEDVNESVVTAEAGELPSIGDNPRRRRGKSGSDHAAVCATFDW